MTTSLFGVNYNFIFTFIEIYFIHIVNTIVLPKFYEIFKG